jgi:hypothetical protein
VVEGGGKNAVESDSRNRSESKIPWSSTVVVCEVRPWPVPHHLLSRFHVIHTRVVLRFWCCVAACTLRRHARRRIVRVLLFSIFVRSYIYSLRALCVVCSTRVSYAFVFHYQNLGLKFLGEFPCMCICVCNIIIVEYAACKIRIALNSSSTFPFVLASKSHHRFENLLHSPPQHARDLRVYCSITRQ